MAAPATASAAPVAPAPSAAPVNATMGEYKAPEAIVSVSTPTVHTHAAAAIAAARAMPREGQEAAPETQAPTAPIGDPSEAKTPPLTPKPPAESEKPAEDSPTARIAQLTRASREAAAREKAAIAREQAAATEAAAAKKEAAALATIREAFKKDPLQAFKELGENWADIVDRVANGGVPPTPEQVAAAEKEKAASELATRLKALEDEREAEKTEAQKQADAAQSKGAIKYVAENLIKADAHPYLMSFAGEAAEEALAQVEEALAVAFKAGKRSSPHPVNMDESLRLTGLALSGLNNHYSDLAKRLNPPAAQQTAATTVKAEPTVVAESKQRGPDTITNAVAGISPPAAQPRRMTPDEARVKAMRLARAMPQ